MFDAKDPDQALDAMARALGYRDYHHAYRRGKVDAFYLLIERVDGENDMKATSNKRNPCEDILNRLSEADLSDLETWRRFEDVDSIHLGGRGRAAWQIEAAQRAWNLLSIEAQLAFLDMRHAVVDDLISAMRDVGIPETDRDIDAVVALLGHDHPAFRVMPAYALASAYLEALDHVEA